MSRTSPTRTATPHFHLQKKDVAFFRIFSYCTGSNSAFPKKVFVKKQGAPKILEFVARTWHVLFATQQKQQLKLTLFCLLRSDFRTPWTTQLKLTAIILNDTSQKLWKLRSQERNWFVSFESLRRQPTPTDSFWFQPRSQSIGVGDEKPLM